MHNAILKAAYLELLQSVDAAYLDVRDRRRGGPKGLSGLFLASVSDDYHIAKNKVMIVGSETAGWELPKKMIDEVINDDPIQLADAYVGMMMKKHQEFFKNRLAQKSNDKGHTFHNFTRAVAKAVGRDGLIYTNLFCFDWHASSPIKSPEFGFVKELSRKILDAQIEALQPDYIIFANGISSAKYRREFFPIGEGARCTHSRSYPEKISSHYLWEFMLDKKIKCFRVHHPSARRKDAGIGRLLAIELLADAVSRGSHEN